MMGKRPLNPVLHHPIKALISDTINNLFLFCFFSQSVAVTSALTRKQVYYNCDEDSQDHLQYVSFKICAVILSRFVCIQMIKPLRV